MPIVLIVDDVAPLAEQYAYDLRRLAGLDTLVAPGGAEALEVLAREAVDCVILDLEMPRMDGFAVMRAMKERGIDVPVIVYTGTGNYDRCVQAIKSGAYTFIDKSESMERVAREVENAVERHRLLQEVTTLRHYAAEESALLGDSAPMRALKDAIARVAPVPSAVLIIGESGSGKELVARDIHRLSGVSREPFVALNCAALPESLVESELFGHERGAFTGAATLRKGAFESAGKGTIFLDEIGELPLAMQAKLLRVLEERQVVRVGSTKPIPVPARVVTATHRELEKEVEEKRFRQDLYFRLNVHVLRVPPLRERLSDVPILVEHLLAVTCERFGMRPKRVAEPALALLMAYDWHRNNVRELRNVVERMVIASDGDVIDADAVPAEIRSAGTTARTPATAAAQRRGSFLDQKTEAERQIVLLALERNEWQITRTAEELGLADHASLLKIMRRHGIARE
ncbi:MAG TPA: sigma-54 dependent transcriptional regulator [Gemmatimonadaceae bacterium]|nr:sigma-54 dependent transcriptional regulator [Gemmatimonadaceae bacterium]